MMIFDSSDPSDKSDKSDPIHPPERIILPHGGYRKLRSFHVARVIYDATVMFCDRFVEKRSRTHDQMVQAARSGVQNIAEGSMASATSAKMELKLTGVARASLEELLLDYQDFIRHHGLCLWPKESPAAMAVRHQHQVAPSKGLEPSDLPEGADPYGIASASPEAAANTLVCLINQATYLLHRQIKELENQFLHHGGFTERLYQARFKHRSPARSSPPCPCCGKPMARRLARKGPQAGKPFWGCSAYPICAGIRPFDQAS